MTKQKKKNKNPKNVALYIKQLQKLGIITLLVFCSYRLYIKQINFALSACLGIVFSYLILNNLIQTQVAILSQKNKTLVFSRYFSRLFLYAVPVSLSLYMKNYLSFGVTLSFLFYFQALYLIMEIITMTKRLKKKKK